VGPRIADDSTDLMGLYSSSNGDTWFLEKMTPGRFLSFTNLMNPPAGHRSRIPAEEHLKRSHAPERQALLSALNESKQSDLDEEALQAVMRDCPL